MRRPFLTWTLLAASTTTAAVAVDVAPAKAADSSAPAGLVTLFNGKDLSGWHGEATMDPRKLDAMSDEARQMVLEKGAEDVKKHWRVENGVLINDGQGAYLTTDKDYGDIELTVDFKIGPKGDSGVYLRGTPQIQIWDFTETDKTPLGEDKRKGSGGLWNNAPGAPGKDPLVVADNPIGEWNSFRIIQVGERTTVYLNGKLVVDHARLANYWNRKEPLPARAPIQLQTHNHRIEWRNIAVRELSPDEANKILAEHGHSGFRSIFNGENLAQWAGAVENYEAVNGTIRCKPHKGGVLYFPEELKNFAARVEFKLPPGGNNGLAIRYPGHGDTAYQGMTELQVLDDGDKRYEGKIDARQAHGSAYGMVAARRGYLRPVGQWNFEEVTVKGSTIRVELNGTVILDADLSKVKDYMHKSPHPGKDRTSGYFGFAGHSDPVEFRNVAIKTLD